MPPAFSAQLIELGFSEPERMIVLTGAFSIFVPGTAAARVPLAFRQLINETLELHFD
jgi:hypothetical protein